MKKKKEGISMGWFFPIDNRLYRIMGWRIVRNTLFCKEALAF